ncbi:MAG: helix-turn-helix domain-containing protein [bacterium]
MLRTKKQIKTICTECPLAKTANLIGDTFTLLIIRDLLSEPKRFSEIESSLKGISSRTITKKLKLLETKNLIQKHISNERPPKTRYSLTKNGKALYKILETMRTYGEKYL